MIKKYLSIIFVLVFAVLIFAAQETNAIQNVIGVRVIKNAGDLTNYPHTYVNGILSPLEWYKKNVPNPGNPTALSLDGYPAIQDGRTIYVAATNKIGTGDEIKLYSNIYLISFNQGAEAEVSEIVSQLIRTWKFNVNISYKDDPDYLLRNRIRKDLIRALDINEFRKLLEIYKNDKSIYPDLRAGTYQTGWSYSVWPSWQETLGKELGSSMVTDPVNEFNGCNVDGLDPKTCWNETKKQFICPQGARVYAYRSLAEGDKYELYANFEYQGTGSWQGDSQTPQDAAGCFFYESIDIADKDLDGNTDQYDNCPDGEKFSEITCSDNQKYLFMTVDTLQLGEPCFVLPNRPGLCYQPKNVDPAKRAKAECDLDRDGVGDACDECPLDPENDRDKDGFCVGLMFRGSDVGGTKFGGEDNCPFVPNPDQINTDEWLEVQSGLQQVGDACSSYGTCGNGKQEGFEVCDYEDGIADNSTCDANCSIWRCNRDWVREGDLCIPDIDNDGIGDKYDNCPNDPNTDQYNSDGDEYGQVCDWCEDDPKNDEDGDGICVGPRFQIQHKQGGNDNCPIDGNTLQGDIDIDGKGDACDICPYDPLDDQDGDGWCVCPPQFQGNCTLNNTVNQTARNMGPEEQARVAFSSTIWNPWKFLKDKLKGNRVLKIAADFYPYRVGMQGAIDNCPTIGNPDQSNLDVGKELQYAWQVMGDACDPDTCGDGDYTGQESCDVGVGVFDGSSQRNPYSCSDDCRTSGGWFTDCILQNNEECELCEKDGLIYFRDQGQKVSIPISQMGIDPRTSYECKVGQGWEGGQCGDGTVQQNEICDPQAGKNAFGPLVGRSASSISDAELAAYQSACDNCQFLNQTCLSNSLLAKGCYLDTNQNGSIQPEECQKGKYTCSGGSVICKDVFSTPTYDYCCIKLNQSSYPNIPFNPSQQFSGISIVFPGTSYSCVLDNCDGYRDNGHGNPNYMQFPQDFEATSSNHYGTQYDYTCDFVCRNRGKICVGVGLSNPQSHACYFINDDAGAACTASPGNLKPIDCKKTFYYWTTHTCVNSPHVFPVKSTACYCK